MRFLANENFPGEAVAALRLLGDDVAWISEDSPGAADIHVLQRAQTEGRILLTFDKDFGELAFRSGFPGTIGIILFRVSMPSPDHVSRLATTAIHQRDDWPGHFSVIEDTRIRMTPLPKKEE